MGSGNWVAFKLMFASPWAADRGLVEKLSLLILVEGITRISFAYWLKLFTLGLVQSDFWMAIWSAIAYGSALGAVGVGNLYRMQWITLLQEKTAFVLDQRVMRLNGEAATIEHHDHPDYLSRMEQLRENRRQLGEGVGVLVSLAQILIMLTMALAILATVNPWLAFLPAFAIPAVLLNRLALGMREAGARESSEPLRQARYAFELSTSPEAGKELRIYGLRESFISRFDVAWSEYCNVNNNVELRGLLITFAGLLLFGFGYGGALLLVVADFAREPTASAAGNLVLVLGLAVQVNQLVSGGVATISALANTTIAYRRVVWLESFIAKSSENGDAGASTTDLPLRISEALELREVSFSYPGQSKAVLDNVNVRILPGSVVAVLGENGAGKSTLIKLLCGFYRPSCGEVVLDGKNIHSFDLTKWRSRTSGLFQDFVKYQFVARENIGVGDIPRVEDTEAVNAAVNLVGIEDLIRSLPSGLETELATDLDGSGKLSGGQWQKVALARAAMREGPLLLFLDEPTSHLDASSEYEIFSRYIKIARTIGRRTGAITFLVSHRFTTTRDADIALVIREGTLSEVGTHEELMEKRGAYFDLYELQRAAYS